MTVIYLKDSEELQTVRTNMRTYILNNDGTPLDQLIDYAETQVGDRAVANAIVREVIDTMIEENLIIELG